MIATATPPPGSLQRMVGLSRSAANEIARLDTETALVHGQAHACVFEVWFPADLTLG
jgi:hypothetical protein